MPKRRLQSRAMSINRRGGNKGFYTGLVHNNIDENDNDRAVPLVLFIKIL